MKLEVGDCCNLVFADNTFDAVYTKEWLSRTKMAEKGFKKFEPEELVELGKQTFVRDEENL